MGEGKCPGSAGVSPAAIGVPPVAYSEANGETPFGATGTVAVPRPFKWVRAGASNSRHATLFFRPVWLGFGYIRSGYFGHVHKADEHFVKRLVAPRDGLVGVGIGRISGRIIESARA
jgi:hypothetical protein